MNFLVLLLFIGNIFGLGHISYPGVGWRTLNFAEPVEKRRLNGSVIKDEEVESELACQFKCVGEHRCQSYNFGPSETSLTKHLCQLSNSDRFVDRENFIEDANFKYGGFQVSSAFIYPFEKENFKVNVVAGEVFEA